MATTIVIRSAKESAETAAWSRRYQAALRRHLQPGAATRLLPALSLGRQAATLGLETLDVVRIHAQALTTMAARGGSSRRFQNSLDRAKAFFAETIVPIENAHPAALQAEARVTRLTRVLRQRTRETLTRHRQLQQGILRRQAAEAALRKSGTHRATLLADAHRLQTRLQRLAREILLAQEHERRQTSRRLHDEIAQALLAVSVRLLTLRVAAKVNTRNLKNEIAMTQRLVKQSVKMIRRLAHECDGNHEA